MSHAMQLKSLQLKSNQEVNANSEGAEGPGLAVSGLRAG